MGAICEVIGFDDGPGFFTRQALFIEASGFLLTSRLPPSCQSFYCYWRDEEGQLDMLEGKWICDHPNYDVALIKVDCPENKKFPFLLIDYSPLHTGEWLIRLIQDAKNQVSKPSLCCISSYLKEVQEELLPHQGIIDQGSQETIEGAPYLNLKGKLVAIHNRSEKRFSTFTAMHPLQDWLSNFLVNEK